MIRTLLKDIFVPEKVGSYYLVPKRVLAFDIGKSEIYATQLYFYSKKIVIEKCIQEQLEVDTTKSYDERVSATIQKIISQADKYDELRSSISSNLAIFKELTFPFTDTQKIKMVLPFELEPSLPFSINDAVIDFIVTNHQNNQITILAVALKKEFIAQHVAFFQHAGVKLDVVTLDVFDLYSLYKTIPAYYEKPGNAILLDVGFSTTNITYISQGVLKATRSLPKGLTNIAKSLSQSLHIPSHEALNELLRFGLERYDNPDYNQAITKSLSEWWSEIQFTLDAFLTKFNAQETISMIYLLSKGAEIAKITDFISSHAQAPCVVFDVNELLKLPYVSTKDKKRISPGNTLSISTALDTYVTSDFNLAQQEFSPSTMSLFYRQLSTIMILTILPILILITYSFMQSRKLNQTARSLEREAVNYLKEQGLTDANNLTTAISEAQEKVQREAEIWFAFSSQTRFSFLKYLEQLSTAIDRKSIGLKLNKLILTYDTIVLDGEVAGFNELKTFERELEESKMFIDIPSLQSTKFPHLELRLKKNEEV